MPRRKNPDAVKRSGPGRPSNAELEARQALLNQAALQRAARIELARRDLTAFAEMVLKDEDGSSIHAAPIHQSWVDHLYYCWKIKKASLILSPYAHGKTQWMALALPLWLLGLNPNLRIIMVSSAEDIAAKRLQKVADYIVNNPDYHEIFPWVKADYSKPWNAHALNVIREGKAGAMTGSIDYSMAAYGYTSSEGQGSRADVLLMDDVCDEKNSCISPSNRKNLIGLVTTQWLSRVDKKKPVRDRAGNIISEGGIIAAIGTRFHQEDLYGFWMDSPTAYCCLIQSVSDNFTHLDFDIIGAIKDPPHPLTTQYGNWSPTELPEESTNIVAA